MLKSRDYFKTFRYNYKPKNILIYEYDLKQKACPWNYCSGFADVDQHTGPTTEQARDWVVHPHC